MASQKKSRKWWQQAQRDQRAFEAWLDRVEPPFARKVARSKNKLINKISSVYALSPDSAFSLYEREHRAEIERLLSDVYAKVIPKRAGDTLDGIRSLKRWPNYAGYFDRLIARWTSQNALENAIGISDTTMRDIQRIIKRGIADGMSSASVAREIRKVKALSVYRANVIARTEIHSASLFAQEEIAKQAQADFGIKLMKFWIPTLDARTRDAHAAMSRHPGVESGGKFIVGGASMTRPGDPAGGASNVINCRCGLVHREVEYQIE
jgi:hypothetical protein